MAKSPSTPNQLGLTRGKAILLGVLAVSLVGVLYVQLGPSGGGNDVESIDTPAHRPIARTPRIALKTVSTVGTMSDDDAEVALLEFDQAKWTAPNVSAVIAYDPFALPASFPQPPKIVQTPKSSAAAEAAASALDPKRLAKQLEELRTQLEDLKQRGVHVIISQNDQYVAMIGDRMIHVGDEINGFTVTGIDPDGVRVERKDSE